MSDARQPAQTEKYEVLNPWGEADPVPLRGISPRLPDLAGKRIGMFAAQAKPASRPIMEVVGRKLAERFPSATFSWFLFDHNLNVAESGDKQRFKLWGQGIDVAVAAVGD
jgi:hypothetical protein